MRVMRWRLATLQRGRRAFGEGRAKHAGGHGEAPPPRRSDRRAAPRTPRGVLREQRSALLSLLQEVPGTETDTVMALREFQDLELHWGEDLVPVLRALGAKSLWHSAVQLFLEESCQSFPRMQRFRQAAATFEGAAALNATLNACQKEGRWEICLSLLNSALERRSFVDVVSFNSAIHACQEGAVWPVALQLLQMLQESAIDASDATWSSCIAVCGAKAQWQRSLFLLHSGAALGPVSSGAALAACAQGEAWEEALSLLQLMHERGPEPNVICCNAVLNALAKAAQWSKALAQLQRMDKSNATTVISFNSVLSALRQSWSRCLTLLRHMQDMSVANEASYNTCIASLGGALQWRQALQIFQGTPGAEAALLGTVATAAAWQQALQLLGGVKSPDTLCYNAAMRACERAHEWQRALLIFQQVEAKNRSSASFCSACTALSRAERWEEAVQLMRLARARNLASRPVLGAAIFGAARGMAWEVALGIFSSMREALLEPDDSIRHSLLPVLPAEQAAEVLSWLNAEPP